MLPRKTSGPKTMSICITSPNEAGRETGVVFHGVFRIVDKSPTSRTASAGVESDIQYPDICLLNDLL
jgi:hypothetical protein